MGITELAPILISLVGAATATLSTIYTLRSERRRKDAEANQAEEAAHTAATSRQQLENEITERVLARANRDMEQMNARIAAQDTKISKLAAENHALRVWASMLCQQIVQLGQEPVKMPEVL